MADEIELPKINLTKSIVFYEKLPSGKYIPRWLGGTDDAVHVKTNNVPASAGAIPIIYGANTQGKIQIGTGGATSLGTNPIIGFNGFPPGTRHLIIAMFIITQTNTAADLMFAAVNEGSIANYETLFDAVDFKEPQAAFRTAADQGVQFAGWMEPFIRFDHTDEDGDITDVGIAFADQSATGAGGTNPNYGAVYYW